MPNSYKCAGKLLATVLSTEVALCKNTNCKCNYKDMEQYYDLTFSFIKKKCTSTSTNDSKYKIISDWNNNVKESYAISNDSELVIIDNDMGLITMTRFK